MLGGTANTALETGGEGAEAGGNCGGGFGLVLEGGGVVVGSPVGGLGGKLGVGIEIGVGLRLGLDVGEVGWLDPMAGGGRFEEEEAGGVIGLEIGLGKAMGEGQESPKHMCDFWRR